MKIGIADLKKISMAEKEWALSVGFVGKTISDTERYHVFCLKHVDDRGRHELFNPNNRPKYYVQRNCHNIMYDITQEFYVPTGTFSVEHGMQTLCCLEGFLHDASGFPAITSMFGDEYYLHGQYYRPIDYFNYLEKEKGRYPEYQPHKYIEFMANILGRKVSP